MRTEEFGSLARKVASIATERVDNALGLLLDLQLVTLGGVVEVEFELLVEDFFADMTLVTLFLEVALRVPLRPCNGLVHMRPVVGQTPAICFLDLLRFLELESSVVLDVLETILLLDLGSNHLKLLVGEVEITGNHLAEWIVTVVSAPRQGLKFPRTIHLHVLVLREVH